MTMTRTASPARRSRDQVVRPLIPLDLPDPDVVRVGDWYYMVSTTMHFFPGASLLKSQDLIHWEWAGHVFDELDDGPAIRLAKDAQAYGKGMWAASLRWHQGQFHVCFCSCHNRKTYLYRATDPQGPWSGIEIEGYYHDCSLLFDDDGRTYLVHGQSEIHLTELAPDLSRPAPGGLNRCIIQEKDPVHLGYEGAHVHKIQGWYYVFLIHWPSEGHQRRTQACYMAPSLDAPFTGGDVLNDDGGWHNQGIAQGGIIEGPDGKWRAILFQDRGAAGRMPVMMDMRWEGNRPVMGKPLSPCSGAEEGPSLQGPGFRDPGINPQDAPGLAPWWQWNHQPLKSHWELDSHKDVLSIRTERLVRSMDRAVNTLTQRAEYPRALVRVRVDASAMKPGDYAGLAALQADHGYVAIHRGEDRFWLVQGRKAHVGAPSRDDWFQVRIPWPKDQAHLQLDLDFRDRADTAHFMVEGSEGWISLGPSLPLRFDLAHFTGTRPALFVYSTMSPGGQAQFRDFTQTRI